VLTSSLRARVRAPTRKKAGIRTALLLQASLNSFPLLLKYRREDLNLHGVAPNGF
jgi:hypothetical protein